ncbi:MAG TPA: FadR/GntR family transcriptional regulator [Candidatus Limnocylindrales bacterium]|nr:FadR/GntR family transcriptional regulator [Candidatus Limnocylindrales bacterium]
MSSRERPSVGPSGVSDDPGRLPAGRHRPSRNGAVRGTAAGLVGELFAPLRLRNAGEQVAERLVTALALGEFVLGQRLPAERDLAATLNVSRTTVREAISRLAATGYVEVRRGRHGGAYVLSGTGPEADEMIRRTLVPGWEQFESLFDFRALVEPLIARTAAIRRTTSDAARIADALASYRAAGDDREASSRADGELHRAIAEAAHNPYLVDLSDRIRLQVSLGFGAEPYSSAIRQRAIGEHGELAQAVLDGDPDRAAAVAGHHFSITEERLRDLHERTRGADGAPPGPRGAADER